MCDLVCGRGEITERQKYACEGWWALGGNTTARGMHHCIRGHGGCFIAATAVTHLCLLLPVAFRVTEQRTPRQAPAARPRH